MAYPQKKHYFTVKEYHAMGEAGIFTEDDRVELIEGEIFEMSPIGSRHASCVNRLNTLLVLRAAQVATISVQNPIEVSDYSEPQPDLTLLKWRADFYASEHPKHSDVLLAIEVSDTTVSFDREYKVALYARAKIPQSVIVNLPGDVVEVYSRPVKGKYTQVQLLKRGQTFSVQKLSGLTLTVDEILG